MAVLPANLRNTRIPILPEGFVRPYEEPEYGATPAVYEGSAQLLNWRLSPKGGMTVELHLRELSPAGVHPFKGMPCGMQNGQRLKVVVSMPHLSDAEEPGETVYLGEAILMRWADDNFSGMMVRLRLDNGPDGTAGRHPFDGLHAGRKEGEHLVFVVWAVVEDERPVNPALIRRRQPFHTLNAVKQAHIMCRDERFVAWLHRRLAALVGDERVRESLPDPEADAARFAAEVVRSWCGIESRAVMNLDTVAGEMARSRWRDLLASYEDDSWGRR